MNTIDTRDLLKRKNELECLRDSLEDYREELEEVKADPDRQNEIEIILENIEGAEEEFDDDARGELSELEELENEISDFRYGEPMILTDNFEEYAREFAKNVGAISNNIKWPCTYIDWKKAAEELAADYIVVTWKNNDYYVRG